MYAMNPGRVFNRLHMHSNRLAVAGNAPAPRRDDEPAAFGVQRVQSTEVHVDRRRQSTFYFLAFLVFLAEKYDIHCIEKASVTIRLFRACVFSGRITCYIIALATLTSPATPKPAARRAQHVTCAMLLRIPRESTCNININPNILYLPRVGARILRMRTGVKLIKRGALCACARCKSMIIVDHVTRKKIKMASPREKNLRSRLESSVLIGCRSV